MNEEILTWFGNLLNFIILIYLVIASIRTNSFDLILSLIAAFGLLISILIHLYTSLKK
jgi:hypothetical protein